METFYKLNRDKIRFAYISASFTLTGFVLLVLTLAFFSKSLPNSNLLIAIFLTAGFGIPFIIILLSYLKWQFRQRARQKLFSIVPFNQLENIGFVDTFLNVDKKWHFTENCKCFKTNGYTLKADISEEFSKTLELEIPVEWKILDNQAIINLKNKFQKHNIYLSIGCLIKRYKTNEQIFLNINELKLDIENYISLIKEEGFKPSKNGCV